jgi:hypothetical protein
MGYPKGGEHAQIHMTQSKYVGAGIVREYCSRFPKAPTRTITEMIYRDHPQVWPNKEAARSSVRCVRGSNGDKHRKKIPLDPDLAQQPKSSDPFGRLPEPKKEWDAEWSAEQFGEGVYLLLQDIHIPYHDPVLKIALEEGRRVNPTHIILNGDVCDFFSVSKWQNDPRQRDLPGEIRDTRQFLEVVREAFPKAEIVWNLGNHEERWERYLWCKAPEVAGVAEFSYESIFHTDQYGVRVSGEKRPLRLGKINVIHGHEYSFPISNPVNPARGLFLRAKTHAICGHFHQPSNHSERTLEQLTVGTWSIGCLCNLHPRYRPLNNWNHGFCWVEVDKEGTFQVHAKKIISGKVYSA